MLPALQWNGAVGERRADVDDCAATFAKMRGRGPAPMHHTPDDEPADRSAHKGLTEPSGDLRERGGYPGHVAGSSVYTKAALRPARTGAAIVGLCLVAAGLRRVMREDRSLAR